MDINPNINLLSALGLIADIVGALIVFFKGVPSKIEESKSNLVFGDPSMSEQEEMSIRRMAKVGVLLLIGGFLLQLVGIIFHINI